MRRLEGMAAFVVLVSRKRDTRLICVAFVQYFCRCGCSACVVGVSGV
jgi:hypothetical protein